MYELTLCHLQDGSARTSLAAIHPKSLAVWMLESAELKMKRMEKRLASRAQASKQPGFLACDQCLQIVWVELWEEERSLRLVDVLLLHRQAVRGVRLEVIGVRG